MATSHIFNGKVVKLPGAYSVVKGQKSNNIIVNNYGKVLIINTSVTNHFGGSVNGELTKGKDSLVEMVSLQEAQSFLRTGDLYHITTPLFRPSRRAGTVGVSSIYYMNALTTTAPAMTIAFTSPATMTIKCKDEGVNSNGATGSNYGLATGYGLRIIAGIKTPSKYIFQFWRGTFKGLAADNIPYDGVAKTDCRPDLLFQSPEVSTLAEFVAWANGNSNFVSGFSLTYTDLAEGTYNFQSSDLTSSGQYVLASGGTATYTSSDLESALSILSNLDFNIILMTEKAGDSGSNDTKAARLQYFIQNELTGISKDKFLAVPGKDSNSSTDAAANITLAQGFNSDKVWLVHGRVRKNSNLAPIGYREFGTVYLTALLTGLIAGLPPQVPPTFKDVDIDGIAFPLTESQKGDIIDGGVLTVHYDQEFGSFVVLRGVNTIKNNTELQNPDGTSCSIQITRICAQLNTDLVINAKMKIFGNPNGSNRFTVSDQYLKDFTEIYLNSKVATETQDNLIVGFNPSDISVTTDKDVKRVNYSFFTNSEINFVFFTGTSII